MDWLARAFGGGARGSRDLDSEVCSALLSVLDQNLDGAEEALTRAIRSNADGIESYLALARLYRMRGEIGRAIRVHQNLLLREDLRKEQRLMALAGLGADFRQGGFEDRAIACYEDVLLDDKRDLKSLRALVQLYAQDGPVFAGRRVLTAADTARRERSRRRGGALVRRDGEGPIR